MCAEQEENAVYRGTAAARCQVVFHRQLLIKGTEISSDYTVSLLKVEISSSETGTRVWVHAGCVPAAAGCSAGTRGREPDTGSDDVVFVQHSLTSLQA